MEEPSLEELQCISPILHWELLRIHHHVDYRHKDFFDSSTLQKKEKIIFAFHLIFRSFSF